MDEQEIVCLLCDQQMTPLYLGPEKYLLYVHRGEQLNKCHALRLNMNVMKRLMDRMNRFGAKFEAELNADNPRVFGQPEKST